jgi:hypothetical protein
VSIKYLIVNDQVPQKELVTLLRKRIKIGINGQYQKMWTGALESLYLHQVLLARPTCMLALSQLKELAIKIRSLANIPPLLNKCLDKKD